MKTDLQRLKAFDKLLEDYPRGYGEPRDDRREVRPYAWPGGYQIVFYIDGELTCFDCVKEFVEEYRLQVLGAFCQWCEYGDLEFRDDITYDNLPEAAEVLWEGPSDNCHNCNKVLETEYGDPDAESEGGSDED